MPDGFTLGAEPSKLDASLVGKHIYMRWKDYGWQLGKVYEQITSANPRLLKKYNYRVIWADTPPRARPAFVSRTTRTARTRLSTRGWCWSARRVAPAEPSSSRVGGGSQRAARRTRVGG